MALNADEMQQLGQAIADGLAKNNRQKKTIGQYLATAKNIYHPAGIARAPRLKREVYICGIRENPELLFDQEISLYNRIKHSGMYVNRFVTVIVRDDQDPATLELRWKSKDLDDRIEQKSLWRNKVELLQLILAEQAEKFPEPEPEEPKRKPFFGSKATQEARAAAAAREEKALARDAREAAQAVVEPPAEPGV